MIRGNRCDWITCSPELAADDLLRAVDGQQMLASALTRRGIRTAAQAAGFLDPDCYQPCQPENLPDLAKAVDRLEAAVRSGEPICVWGDFDVDGQTSTTLLVSVLRELGGLISYRIPVRASESHGVNLPGLEDVLSAGATLILTCDTGSSAHGAVEYAAARGVDFVVTDHHELPEELPAAKAVVNPRRLPAGHALSGLPGVGTAFQVALALCRRSGREEHALAALDLVALGIVADLAPLTGDTRYLLQRGLQALRQTSRPGLLALFEMAQLDPDRITEEHIGFIIGPRLNALGRLADANLAVEFLTTRSTVRARTLAAELEGLNAQRRLLCEQVYGAARAQLDREPGLLDEPALVLAQPGWPAGVIGIVASRLVEETGRPVVLFSSPLGGLARGSARSIAGCHITQAIAEAGHLLAGYGGHPMAAGLGLDPANLPEFRRLLNRAVSDQIGKEPRRPRLEFDAVVELGRLDMEFVEDVERMAPFGQGNPPLVLQVEDLELKGKTAVGKNGDHLQLIVADTAGQTRKVMWWQGSGRDLPKGRFDLACTVRSSDYRGQNQLQVEWIDFRPTAGEVIEVRDKTGARRVEDSRKAARETLLKTLSAEPDTLIWAEGGSASGVTRDQLRVCRHLVVWTSPPGNSDLQTALEITRAEQVTLVGVDPGLDHLETFLRRLAGLAKYALGENLGQVSVSSLAGQTAQREQTVRLGLDWLAARGWIEVHQGEPGGTSLSAGSGIDLHIQRNDIEALLRSLLAETAAYRSYFRSADSANLL